MNEYNVRQLGCLYGYFLYNSNPKPVIDLLQSLINEKTYKKQNIDVNPLLRSPAIAIYGSNHFRPDEIVKFAEMDSNEKDKNTNVCYTMGIYTLIKTGNYYKAWCNAHTVANEENKQILEDAKLLEGIHPLQKSFYRLYYSREIDNPINGAMVGTIYPPNDEKELIKLHSNNYYNNWLKTITKLLPNI